MLYKYLEILIDGELKWTDQIRYVYKNLLNSQNYVDRFLLKIQHFMLLCTHMFYRAMLHRARYCYGKVVCLSVRQSVCP